MLYTACLCLPNSYANAYLERSILGPRALGDGMRVGHSELVLVKSTFSQFVRPVKMQKMTDKQVLIRH